jgi:hypothetical protein
MLGEGGREWTALVLMVEQVLFFGRNFLLKC